MAVQLHLLNHGQRRKAALCYINLLPYPLGLCYDIIWALGYDFAFKIRNHILRITNAYEYTNTITPFMIYEI